MEKEKTKEEKLETLPAEVRANMLSEEKSIFFNVALFEQAQRIAQMFAASTMVPDHFRGNIGNCMIGLNYAARIKGDPFMVLQCLYVVHGRPGIEGKLVEAVINQSQKYSEPLQYIWLDPEDNEVTRRDVLKAAIPSEYGCQAFTVEKKSGKRVDGPKITWALVKAEGWYDKKGPDGTVESNKWRTMPEMMFYYRSASWFSNKNCPELKLGMHTVEEIEDVVDLNQKANGTFGITGPAADLNERLKESGPSEKGSEMYKTKESQPDKEDPVRKQYIGLRKGDGVKTGLKPWIMSHLEYIPKLEQKYQDEIKEKWIQFYPESFPHLPPEPPKQEAPLVEEHTESTEGTDTEKKDPPFKLNCMLSYEERPEKDDNGRVNVEICENCDQRHVCVSYEKFQKPTLSDEEDQQ